MLRASTKRAKHRSLTEAQTGSSQARQQRNVPHHSANTADTARDSIENVDAAEKQDKEMPDAGPLQTFSLLLPIRG
jgi:hypothetical protein